MHTREHVYLDNSRSISRIVSTSHSFEVEEVANPGCPPPHSSWLCTCSMPLGAWLLCNSLAIKLTSTSPPPLNASDVWSRFLQTMNALCFWTCLVGKYQLAVIAQGKFHLWGSIYKHLQQRT